MARAESHDNFMQMSINGEQEQAKNLLGSSGLSLLLKDGNYISAKSIASGRYSPALSPVHHG